MLIETVLSMLTVTCPLKRMRHRVGHSFRAHLAWTMAALNLMLDRYGLPTTTHRHTHLSIAEFVQLHIMRRGGLPPARPHRGVLSRVVFGGMIRRPLV